MSDTRHIHLRDFGERSRKFKPKGRGSTKYPTPVGDRSRHANKLRSSLEASIETLSEITREQAQYGVPVKRRGLPVALDARVEESPFIGDMKLESRGLQLLSVQPADGDRQQRAILFVKESSAIGLLNALDKYEGWTEDTNRPQRFWLFESADDFRLATVEDLWTDPIDNLPSLYAGSVEWEIWVRKPALAFFQKVAKRLKVEVIAASDGFVDTAIVNVRATRGQVADLVRVSASVVELRAASNFAADFQEADPEERLEIVERLAQNLRAPPDGSVRTTILDTGVNHAHMLLAPALPRERCLAIRPEWDVNDPDGHGTKMAGLALFGNLEPVLANPTRVDLSTGLESIAVLAPRGEEEVPAHIALREAVAIADRDPQPRVFCLAATAKGDADDGRQTSVSSTVDQLAWNDGDETRLFCVAAGNVWSSFDEPYEVADYESRNADHRVQSPGQALNALTVGATTEKCTSDSDLLAPSGDLCPTSRTAQQWTLRYANKPDIVMEGGNHVVGDDGTSQATKDTLVMTTNNDVFYRPLTWVGETSAATAQAAGMATRLASQYPEFRPETLRGMMVHNARWTDAMEARCEAQRKAGRSKSEARLDVIDCFGWGMPDERRLMASARNALTLIIEDSLRPYKEKDNGVRLREMKYFRLPWPRAALRQLNQEEVELRCTLSYFAEPYPHAASRQRLDRYASHRLRFDLKSADDGHGAAQRLINELAEAEDDTISGPGAGDQGWCLGHRSRIRGTLHHDIWTGKAYELANRDGITIYPVKGWWADRKESDIFGRRVNFSLIMSIHSSSQTIDLMTEIQTEIRVRNLIEVASAAIVAT